MLGEHCFGAWQYQHEVSPNSQQKRACGNSAHGSGARRQGRQTDCHSGRVEEKVKRGGVVVAQLLIYTDNQITDAEWDHITGLQLISGLTKLLQLLRSRGNEAIPYGELPDFFKGSHVEQLNAQFSKRKLPYRVANDGNRPWNTVSPYQKRSIKLYKVERRLKKEVPIKQKGPPRCPPIFFNPDRNRPGEKEGVVKVGFVGVKDKERAWTSPEMVVKASLSVGVNGGGFIHILPTRKEVDKIICYLLEMRDLIPEE